MSEWDYCRRALALAREQLAAALTRRDAATDELERIELNMRQLGGAIYALSHILGEPMPDRAANFWRRP